MTLKTYTVEKKNPKNNQEWSWEETPEVLAALEKLHESSKLAASFQQGTKKAPKAPNAATSKSKKKTVDKPSTEAS